MNITHKAAAFSVAGIILFGSLLMTSASAKPPKHGKKPTKPGASTKATPAMIAAGTKVYEANGCAGCHAINGAGGNAGPELSNVGGEAKHNTAWLTMAVATPTKIDADSKMPPYGDKIKGADMKNLVAYLGSLKKAK